MEGEQEFLEEAQRVRDEQVGFGAGTDQGDPAVQAAIDHANETAGTGPEPGSQQPGYFGLGGLSTNEIEAQKMETARQLHEASVKEEQQPTSEARRVTDSQQVLPDVQPGADEQQFLADAERVRDEQVGSGAGTAQGDPAVQAAIDHANETAGTGPEPGSQQPGYFGLGGLSNSEIEAQKQEIAQQKNRP
jgi:hypothetical protein